MSDDQHQLVEEPMTAKILETKITREGDSSRMRLQIDEPRQVAVFQIEGEDPSTIDKMGLRGGRDLAGVNTFSRIFFGISLLTKPDSTTIMRLYHELQYRSFTCDEASKVLEFFRGIKLPRYTGGGWFPQADVDAERGLDDETGVPIIILRGDEANENASDFLKLSARPLSGYCQPGTSMYFLNNSHKLLSIRATVKTAWIYQNENYAEYTDYRVKPGETKAIGCHVPGPTSQEFKRTLVGCNFI